MPMDIHLIHHLKLFTTGYAFVSFDNCKTCNRAVQCLNNKVLRDRPLRVAWSKPSKEYKLKTELEGRTNVLTFANLKYTVTRFDILEFISSAECDVKPQSVEIFENAKGFRYGLAKIWMDECAHATMIVKRLNGKLLEGRAVHINYWREYKKNKNRKKNADHWNDAWFKKNVDDKKKKKSKKQTGMRV